MVYSTSSLDSWQQLDAGRVRLEVPAGWTVHHDVLGATVAARSTAASLDGFHANITVVEQPLAVVDPDALLAAQRVEIETLTDALVLDAGVLDLVGLTATRLLATHRSDDYELTLDQVALPLARSVVTITATAATAQYAALAETFDAIFATVDVDG